MDEFSSLIKSIDPDVEAAFQKIAPLMEAFWDAVPDMYAKEEQIQEQAKARAVVYRDIWNIYKELVEKSVDDQSLKEFIDQLIEGGQFEGKDGGQFVIIDFDSLPPEVQKELAELIDEQQKEDEQQQQQGQQQGQPGQQGQQQPGQEGQPGQQSGAGSGESGEESGESQEAQQDAGSGQSGQPSSQSGSASGQSGEQSQTGESSSQGGKPEIPWDKVSEESKEKIKEQFDKVKEDTKQGMKDKAQQELGEVEDEVNEKLEGKSDKEGVSRPSKVSEKQKQQQKGEKSESGDDSGESSEGESGEGESGEGEAGEGESGEAGQPGQESGESESSESENGKEGEESEEASDSGEENQQSATRKPIPEQKKPSPSPRELPPVPQDILDQIQRANDQFMSEVEDTMEVFDTVSRLPEIKLAIETLVDEFSPIFRPKNHPRTRYSEDEGELDIDRDIDRKRGEGGRDVLAYEEKPNKKNYRFTILVDLSGSMDDKIREAFKMVTILSTVFTALGIEFAVEGFTEFSDGTTMKVFKSYAETEDTDEELSEEQKRNIGGLLMVPSVRE
jgi:hypothetical protein